MSNDIMFSCMIRYMIIHWNINPFFSKPVTAFTQDVTTIVSDCVAQSLGNNLFYSALLSKYISVVDIKNEYIKNVDNVQRDSTYVTA